jgi:hypothetical protein
MKPDMDLSEFIQNTVARAIPGTPDWIVELTLKDLTKSNLTISNCSSEFDAKERAFLYLVDKIYNKSEN